MPPWDERREFWDAVTGVLKSHTFYRFGDRWSARADGRGLSIPVAEMKHRHLYGDTPEEAWALRIGRAKMQVIEAKDDLATEERRLAELEAGAEGAGGRAGE